MGKQNAFYVKKFTASKFYGDQSRGCFSVFSI